MSMKKEAPMDWDTSDTPQEPTPRTSGRRPPPVPIKIKDAQGKPVGPPKFLPGANNAPYTRKREAARPHSQTQQMQAQPPQGQAASWDVEVPGVGTYRVPGAPSSQEAASAVADIVNQENPGRTVDARHFRVSPSPATESGGATAGGSLMGHQAPTYEERLREAVRAMVREVVRKKEGGGGYVLYGPNKGKKKNPKPAGEFPTRFAAKKAELARFPPKDPEQLKKLRKRLDKLTKDPKKRAKAERDDLSGRKKTKKAGKPAGERAKRKEAFIRLMARDLHERLFHEDEVPGSAWDEKVSSLHPDAIASDKKLQALHKNIQTASMGALGDAHKSLAKVLRGTAKVLPGDVAHDPERKKTFVPVMLDVDGVEVGPVHLYVDGGHVKIEVSQDARQQIASMEPDDARDLRGGLMSFQEDHLPEIDTARKAWAERDGYLDKLHGKLEKHANGLSGVEHHLMKQLLTKGKKR